MFAPLDMHGEKRADLHRAARLSMLHERVVKRFDRVDHSADAVETAAAAFVEATHRSSIMADPFRSVGRSQVTAGWTLGL
ncbi:MAG: hypothetical protein EOQ50_10205 [Mesorhizobium sp.]|uniref:hypothetical protein n=1 Tax=Mesorhizobium sp. TaxID=1871066 RepID=UPI000FE9B0D0|nr:hypothetical protein [Mesorhizobium sp.]RWB77265.1 MAG: hypothetical protein EOQ50_10205 [Mesorhizobium sp.]RWL83617.1 MAG: hypothetical protein EOR69_12790 [Mesorhizobium sp.]RWL90768.1 MAG: hypothetical protein EOR67_05130 [Mesorhizobium sp.]RWL92666.1 MAG: hypothetical protein EOR68_25780 [Mesorhizobium sp.]RWL93255.1 MAG: hypothetical protein EOR70_28800 [Mesorhizobium sp.]